MERKLGRSGTVASAKSMHGDHENPALVPAGTTPAASMVGPGERATSSMPTSLFLGPPPKKALRYANR